MPANRMAVCIIAFLGTFVVVGIPYWKIPYSEVSLPGSLAGLGLLLAFVVAAAVRFAFHVPFSKAWVAVGIAVPAAVLARVEFETWRDPTTHNLWPFEVVYAAVVGFSVALGGVLLGSLLTYLVRGRPAESGGG